MSLTFSVVERDHPQRVAVEAQIQQVYNTSYHACLTEFPTRLAALFNTKGNVVAAVGLRTAADGFFSEIYMDQPVEALLEDMWHTPVPRDEIVEISNLASCRSGTSMILMKHVTAVLHHDGINWAVFTATSRLFDLLHCSGCPAVDLLTAERDRVANAAQWGSYYDTAPKVCAVHYDMLAMSLRGEDGEATSKSMPVSTHRTRPEPVPKTPVV